MQIDVGPTLLALLGRELNTSYNMGKNLLQLAAHDGYAFSRRGDTLFYTRSGYLLEFDVKRGVSSLYKLQNSSFVDTSWKVNPQMLKLKSAMEHDAKVYLQATANRLFLGKS